MESFYSCCKIEYLFWRVWEEEVCKQRDMALGMGLQATQLSNYSTWDACLKGISHLHKAGHGQRPATRMDYVIQQNNLFFLIAIACFDQCTSSSVAFR